MKFERFAVIPAIATMLDVNEKFDEAAQRRLVRNLLSKNVDGFYIGGATGEGFLMNSEDRKRVLSVTMEEIGGRVPMIAYTGSNDLKTAIELSEFAEKEGADAISSVRPYYGAFRSSDVMEYYTKLSESVNIPMLVYNNSGAQLSGLSEIVDICNIKNCCGIKYTLTNHYEMALVKKQIGEKFVFSGVDEMFASAMIAKADGAIGSTYSMVPELFMKIREAYENGNNKEVEKYNAIEQELITTMIGYSYFGAMKVMLKVMGIGEKYVRRPNHMLSDGEEKAFINDLKTMKDKYNLSGIEIFDMI